MTAAFVYPINTSMNIQELDAYNLDDAVKFNERLNPRLWDRTEHLKPEVRERLLEIAEDFKEFLGIKDLDLQDITISGSNAAYTYTPNSDIDLHLVVNMPDNEVYRELFDAKKFQYNEQHNIKIGGYDVELYVQDSAQPHISQGIYSIINNDWVQVPRRIKADVDDASTKNKFETVGHQIEQAIASGSLQQMTHMAEKIKKMRQTGLEEHGEFGPENLAFKMLRSQGKIKELYNARNAAKDQELSLKERRKPTRSVFTYGFKHEESVQEGSAGLRPVGLTPDGVSPDTRMIVSDVNDHPTDEEILKDFIDFCVKELKINNIPTVKLRRDPQWSVVHKTFGRYINDRHMLEVAWGQRHIMDILRTVAHELTHKHQHEREEVPASAGETGSEYENEANARAGVLMRDYARLHPDYFAVGQAEELHGDELKEFAPSPEREDDIPNQLVHLANRWWNNAEKQPQIENVLHSLGWSIHQVESEDDAVQLQHRDGTTHFISADDFDPEVFESASGYIPTKKQARDPRYSMALTVDIKPGQVGKEANKLKLKTDRQGHPQIANPNGLFEELQLQLEAFKKAQEDYSPDNPPGPETKPTMPAGTLRVDVSDVYDWYKIGQHISNMKGLGKHDFGAGPPSSIISFGDEELEHKFIKDLEATGLDVTDIDPVDPNQPKGMKKIKTDPTYNVNESEELDEVKMSPTALKKFADSPAAKDILVGFEAEMIVPDVNVDNEQGDMEPDYEQDERCRSIQQVMDFFEYDEYGYGLSGRDAEKLQEQLDEAYFEWHDDQMMRDFREEAEDLIKKVFIDEKDWVQEDEVRKQLDMMEITGADQEAVLKAGSMAPTFNTTAEQQAYMAEHPEYEKYIEALEEAEELLDELVQDSVRSQDKYWDAAIDDFRDNYYIDDDSGFFDDVGLRWMSDVAERFDVYWPYMTFPEGGGSQDIDSVADDLSNAIGMPVKASYSYHGATRKPGEFIIEPDGSLSADSYEDGGLEIISPPMPIAQAMEKLNQVIEWAQEKGCYTNSTTGLHMGVSLPGQKSFAEAEGDDVESAPVAEKPIDFMKLALFLGDQHVLKEFGRQANSYCASTLKKLKEKRWSPQQIATAMEKMRGNLINLAYKDLADRSPGRDSINMKDNYVEFRGAGGDYLSRESNEGMDFLENTLLRYVQALAIAGDPNAYRDEYAKKLYKLISPSGDDTLNLFSQFATGEISSEQLKKDWAKRTLEKDEPSAVNKGNWVVVDNNTGKTVPGQEYSGYTEDEVYEKAKAKLGEYMTKVAFNMAYSIHPKETGRWEVYRDDHGQDETLEIIDADRRGEAVNKAAEIYTGVIPFKVRAYYGDEASKPEPTPRAKLAKNIIQRPEEEVKNWIVYDTVTGEEQYNQPGRKSNLVQAMRKMEQDNKWPRGRLALKLSDNQDISPQASTGQQSTTPEGVPIWEVYEIETGHVVYKFDAATKQQADEQKNLWLAHVGAEQPNLFGVRPKMAQYSVQDVKPNVAQNFTQQAGEQEVDGTGEPIWQIYQVSNDLVMSEITAQDAQEAAQALQDQLDDWATDDDVRELYAVRPKMVETTPQDATERVGSWSIYDVTLGRELSRLDDVPWSQANARAEETERATGHNISVRGLN